jgi:hypothetical protein
VVPTATDLGQASCDQWFSRPVFAIYTQRFADIALRSDLFAHFLIGGRVIVECRVAKRFEPEKQPSDSHMPTRFL